MTTPACSGHQRECSHDARRQAREVDVLLPFDDELSWRQGGVRRRVSCCRAPSPRCSLCSVLIPCSEKKRVTTKLPRTSYMTSVMEATASGTAPVTHQRKTQASTVSMLRASRWPWAWTPPQRRHRGVEMLVEMRRVLVVCPGACFSSAMAWSSKSHHVRCPPHVCVNV
ncbi:uncharacterized protein LOC110430884 isoform X1 [Sorghum bicolor]|nr:uncharacterized protein LOC110430884 isoform X1 [Sorghum bicolor]|eukprot:XP_021304723.1 uncharacterized protein LOC110430884 isoform X1 [Sorghum bicolor]